MCEKCIAGVLTDADLSINYFDFDEQHRLCSCHPAYCDKCKGLGYYYPDEHSLSVDCPDCSASGSTTGQNNSGYRLAVFAISESDGLANFSPVEVMVLMSLDPVDAEVCWQAKTHAEQIGIEKGEYLQHCRTLRDAGLAKLTSLFDYEECCPCGSAYLRTEKGTMMFPERLRGGQ